MNGAISATGLPEYSERASNRGILSSSTTKPATLAGSVITDVVEPPPKKGMNTSSSSSFTIATPVIPYLPIRVEDDGCKYYDLLDVVTFGEPSIYGEENYLVVDNFEVSRPFVLDWRTEQDHYGALRPIHRYSASKRFEYLLKQLLGGCRTEIPWEVIQLVYAEVDTDSPLEIWDAVRLVLKRNGLKKYYNRIPDILKGIKYPLEIIWRNGTDGLVRDFEAINTFFYNFKFDGRVYFPNFKFFAIKLLLHRGAIFEYDVPLLRTGKKLEAFEHLWEILFEALY